VRAILFAGTVMLMCLGSGPASASDPVTVPLLDRAPEVYQTAFMTAVRGFSALGPSGLMQDVESCYENMQADERVARVQYCYFLHASVRMLEEVVPTKKPKVRPADQIEDVRERAQFTLVQAGYSQADSLVILSAWSQVGQGGLPTERFREFRKLVMGR
jgi:hypothetical protein